MKVRTCFVSNSSSSSFVVQGTDTEAIKRRLAECLGSLPGSSQEKAERVVYEGGIIVVPFDRRTMDRNEIRRNVRKVNSKGCSDFSESDFKDGTSVIVTGENVLWDTFGRRDESGFWDFDHDPEKAVELAFGTKREFLG